MTTSLLIEPLDVLLFRDGRPFSAGMDHLAGSVFPPLPSTIAGFIRSRLFVEAGGDWLRARERFGDLGGPDGYGDFRIEGLFLRRDGTDYVPVPGDVVRPKGSADGGPFMLSRPLGPGGTPPITSNFPDRRLRFLWARTADVVEPAQGFVALEDLFSSYLLGEPPARVAREEEFVGREPRTGIGMDRERRSAGEGRLFLVEFVRLLDGVGLHVRFSGVRWPGTSGADTLGGERRPVRWTTVDRFALPPAGPVAEKVGVSGRFKLVLLTPALFEDGWRPGRRFEEALREAGVDADLVAAAVGRPVHAGGFDLHRQRPRTMHRAAPAGSVYFYEVHRGDPSRLAGSWGIRAVSDVGWEAGMGLSVLGGWDHA